MHDLGRAAAFFTVLAGFQAAGCTVLIDLPDPHEEESRQDAGSGGRSATGGASGSGGAGGSEASTSTGGAGGASSGGVGGSQADSGTAGEAGHEASVDASRDASEDVTDGDGPDASVDAAPQLDAAPEATPHVDATLDAPDDGGCPCDCDRDGYQAAACNPVGEADCDDNDGNVHPGQTAFFDEEHPVVGWDYNCNDMDERQYTQTVQCSLVCNTAARGYNTTAPECGQGGPWGMCNSAVLCTFSQLEYLPQKCR